MIGNGVRWRVPEAYGVRWRVPEAYGVRWGMSAIYHFFARSDNITTIIEK